MTAKKRAKDETNQARSRRRSSPDWAPKFLRSLSLHGNIRKACAAARIGRAAVYHRRDSDEDFAAAMADALEDAADRLEEVADQRAKKKSDALLMFRLKALRPQRYRDVSPRAEASADAGALSVQVNVTVVDAANSSQPEAAPGAGAVSSQ